MVRKVCSNSIGALVQACLQMMCDIEEEEDWAVSDEPQVKLRKSAPKDEIILQYDDKPSGGMILMIPKDVYNPLKIVLWIQQQLTDSNRVGINS